MLYTKRLFIFLFIFLFYFASDCNAQEQTLILRNVRQYVVTLADDKSVVVIDGEVLNSTSAPLTWISVAATLFDEKGNVVDSARQICGSVLGAKKLASMKSEEIVSHLSSYHQLQTQPVVVSPNHAIPFMVVFPDGNIPYEFSVSAYVLDLGKE